MNLSFNKTEKILSSLWIYHSIKLKKKKFISYFKKLLTNKFVIQLWDELMCDVRSADINIWGYIIYMYLISSKLKMNMFFTLYHVSQWLNQYRFKVHHGINGSWAIFAWFDELYQSKGSFLHYSQISMGLSELYAHDPPSERTLEIVPSLKQLIKYWNFPIGQQMAWSQLSSSPTAAEILKIFS